MGPSRSADVRGPREGRCKEGRAQTREMKKSDGIRPACRGDKADSI